MSAIFLKILDMSYAAGWLMAAVILARLLLKKAPKRMVCLLWALAAVRLLCPFSIKSALSLIPDREPLTGNAVLEITLPAETVMQNQYPPAPVNGGHPEIGEGDMSGQAEYDVTGALSAVWAAGAVLMLGYGIIGYFSVKKRTAASIPVRENIMKCDAVDTPFILGVLRPRIFLPSAMEDYGMEYVVAHEQAHIKRHDHWWKPMGFLILCVYWFHPLCWISYVLFCRDMELACDESVVGMMDMENKKAYAKALLSYSMNRRRIAAYPLAFGEVGVKERIRNVLDYKKPAFWITAVSVLAGIAVAICFLTDPGRKDGEGTSPVSDVPEGEEDLRAENADNAGADGGTKGNEGMETDAETPGRLVDRWARAFVDRDGDAIASMASPEVRDELAGIDLLAGGGTEGAYSFGLSSPWPRDTNTDFTVHFYDDIGKAEIYYYAQTSDPHVFVWRELLSYEKEGDSYIVTEEELVYYDDISSGAEYAEAYPGGIGATMIDYTWNGLGEALNDHAASSGNDKYQALLSPESAAVSLLNLSTDPKDVSISVYDGSEESGMVGLDILFLRDQYQVTVSMVQPYGGNGIWVPADYTVDVISRFMNIPWDEMEAITEIGYYDSSRYNNVICIGEIPEYDIRVYGYNDEDISGRGVAIEIAGDVNYFDWDYTSPQNILPDLYWDEDERELWMALHTFTGTGVSAEELVMLQHYDTGTLVPYYFGYHDYTELLRERIEYRFDSGSRELTLTDTATGREAASVMVPEGEITEIECGSISYFELGETVRLFVRPGYFCDGNAIAEYDDMPVLEFELEYEWFSTASGDTDISFVLGDLVGVHEDED